MFTRRSFGTAFIAGIAALSLLTSCSGGASKSSSGSEEKLTFMMLGASQKSIEHIEKNVLPEFKKKTGVTVTLQTSDWGSAFQKYTTAAASKQMADVVSLGAIWTAPLADKGALLDLGPYMDKWADKDKIFPELLKDGQWDGKQYSIPYGFDLRVPVYRKDLLEKAGVDTTKLPTTWEEFHQVALKVRDAGICESPIFWGTDKSIGLQQGFAQLMMQNEAKYWKEDGTSNFSSPQAREALDFLVTSFKEGTADYHLVYSGSGARPLVSGQSAMGLGSRNDYYNAESTNPEVAKQLLIGPALVGPSASKGAAGAWINKLAIAKNSKNPDKAFEFISFLMEKDNLSAFDESYGVLPVRTDLAEASWLGETGLQLMALAKDAQSQPPHPGMMQFGGDINKLLDPAVRGSVGVDETLAAIDQKLNAFGH